MSMKFSTVYSNIGRTWFFVKSSFNGEWVLKQGNELLQCEDSNVRQIVKKAFNELLIGENEVNSGMIRVFDLEDDINFLRDFLISLPNVYTTPKEGIDKGLFWCFCNDWKTPTPICDPNDKRQILVAIDNCFVNYDSDLAKTFYFLLKEKTRSYGRHIVHFDNAYLD